MNVMNHRLFRGAYSRLVPRVLGEDHTRADGHCRFPPEFLVLGINNVCNLHCKMCDVGLGEQGTVFWANLIGDHPQNMSLELLNEILRQARGFWPRPRIGLAFTEPLIHPKILDFCQAIKSQGFVCTITTNGTQLPRHAEALVDLGVDEIVVSVDGPREVHNRIRGGRETFEKLTRGAQLLNDAKQRAGKTRPVLRFSFTVTDENYRHILEFIREVELLRPADINISQLNFITEAMAADHNSLLSEGTFRRRAVDDLAVMRSNLGMMDPTTFETEVIWQELERVRAYTRSRSGQGPGITIVPDSASRQELDVYYQEHHRFVGGRQCTDPWKLMMIKTDGTVIPSHGRCYNYPLGNIAEQPLAEIWNGERLVGFRQTLHAVGGTLPACARCCGVIGKPPQR